MRLTLYSRQITFQSAHAQRPPHQRLRSSRLSVEVEIAKFRSERLDFATPVVAKTYPLCRDRTGEIAGPTRCDPAVAKSDWFDLQPKATDAPHNRCRDPGQYSKPHIPAIGDKEAERLQASQSEREHHHGHNYQEGQQRRAPVPEYQPPRRAQDDHAGHDDEPNYCNHLVFATRADVPALMCTTVPPAKSSAPMLPRNPPTPQTNPRADHK